MSDSFQPQGLQYARPPCPSPSPRTCSNSCTSRWWCHPTISFSVSPFSPCLWSFPAWGSFQMSQFFTSGGQSIGASASASVLPMNIRDWSPSGWTGWISLQFKRLSKPSPLQHHHNHEKFLYCIFPSDQWRFLAPSLCIYWPKKNSFFTSTSQVVPGKSPKCVALLCLLWAK